MNILITGASRGLGRAIALEFAKSPFTNFFLIYNQDHIKMRELTIDLQRKYCNVYPYQLDIKDRNKCKYTAFKIKEFNSDFEIDTIINNAGIIKDRTFAKMTDDEWDNVINVNLNGTYNITKAFLPYFNPKGGNIINIGSVIGTLGNFGQTNYSASKAGLIGFTKSLAKELAPKNIRVNMVSPSIVETDIFNKLTVEQRQALIDRTLLKRFAKPKEIAKFVVFLVKKGTYCTGQNYLVDGGFN